MSNEVLVLKNKRGQETLGSLSGQPFGEHSPSIWVKAERQSPDTGIWPFRRGQWRTSVTYWSTGESRSVEGRYRGAAQAVFGGIRQLLRTN